MGRCETTVGSSRAPKSGITHPPSSRRRRRLTVGGLAVGEGGHDFAREEPEARQHVGLGDDFYGVEQEVHPVDAHRLPPLQRAQDALRPAQGQPLARLLVGVGASGLAAELGQEAQRLVRARSGRPRGPR